MGLVFPLLGGSSWLTIASLRIIVSSRMSWTWSLFQGQATLKTNDLLGRTLWLVKSQDLQSSCVYLLLKPGRNGHPLFTWVRNPYPQGWWLCSLFPDELEYDATNAEPFPFQKKAPWKKETGLEHEKFSRCLLTFRCFHDWITPSIRCILWCRLKFPQESVSERFVQDRRKKEWGSGDEVMKNLEKMDHQELLVLSPWVTLFPSH